MSRLPTEGIERESVEYLFVLPAVNGVPVVSGVDVAITVKDGTTRPSSWTAASVVDGKACVLVGTGGLDLAAGTYNVWARYTSAPEVPVVLCGTLLVT